MSEQLKNLPLSLPTESGLAVLDKLAGRYTGDAEKMVWRVRDYAKSRDETRPRATLADIGLLYLFVERVRTDAKLLVDNANRLESFLGSGGTLDQLRFEGTADLPVGEYTSEEIAELVAEVSSGDADGD